MSLHRRCCCVSGECATSWGSCPSTLRLSVLAMNMQRRGIACDSGSIGCSWAGLTITDDLNAAVEDLEFEYVPPSGGDPSFYRVVPAASNGGTITVSLSSASDPHPFTESGGGSCASSFGTGGLGSFSGTFASPGLDVVVDELTGSIRSIPFWTGSVWECRFVMKVNLRVTKYDGYDYSQLVGAGGFQAVSNGSAKFSFDMDLLATAPYSASACPQDQVWTVENLSYLIFLDDAVSPFGSGIPEDPKFTSCIVGTPVDCAAGTPSGCRFALGYDSAMAPYFSGGFDASGFVLWSNDTPTVGLTT